MFDRLLALTMALTLAAGAIVQPPCCCETPGGSCRIDQEFSSPAASSVPACCATEAALPPCCVAKQVAKEASTSAASMPCDCDGCPTNRPDNPLNESTVAPRAPALDDLPLALSAGPMDPPLAVSLVESQQARWESLSLDRPPPDRQAVLCVWVI